jgi:hypothetical protein
MGRRPKAIQFTDQHIAVADLMLCGVKQQDIAAQTGIGERKQRRWKNQPWWRELYESRRKEMDDRMAEKTLGTHAERVKEMALIAAEIREKRILARDSGKPKTHIEMAKLQTGILSEMSKMTGDFGKSPTETGADIVIVKEPWQEALPGPAEIEGEFEEDDHAESA